MIYIFNILDKTIIYSVANKTWGLLSGILSLYFLTRYFNNIELGYYYLISSILAVQIIFEGGFSVALMTYFSKYRSSSAINEGNLSDIFNYGKKWYKKIAVLFFLAVSTFGFLFINTKGVSGFWEYPWFLSVALTSISILYLPYITLFESMGYLGYIQAFKLTFSFIGIVISWILMVNGFGIYSIACILFFNIIRDQLIVIKLRESLIKINISKNNNLSEFKFDELKLMKYKLAISNLSMYLGFNLFIPVLYYFYDAKIAGKMGLTWSALTAIQAIGAAITYTKYPLLVELVHNGNFNKAKEDWLRISIFSILTVSIGIVSFIAIYVFFKFNGIYIIDKFADLNTIIVLSIGMISLQVVNCLNVAIRSFGRELLTNVNVLCNLLTGLMIIVLAKNFSIIGISIAFTSITLFIALPWEILILKKLWNQNARY